MAERNWVKIETVSGDLTAELLRGLLEAQEISVLLSKEGATRAIGFEVGPMGSVDILVPDDKEDQARQVLNDYHAGKFETQDESEEGGSPGNPPEKE